MFSHAITSHGPRNTHRTTRRNPRPSDPPKQRRQGRNFRTAAPDDRAARQDYPRRNFELNRLRTTQMKIRFTAPTEAFPFYSDVKVNTGNGWRRVLENH